MAGLLGGHGIPKLLPSQTSDMTAVDRHYRVLPPAVTAANIGSLPDVSREDRRRVFSRIYSKRCTYCKDFHSEYSYCSRLKKLNKITMSSDSSESSDEVVDQGDKSDSSDSSVEEEDEEVEGPVGDGWGPKTDPSELSKQLVGFLKKHQRVDTKPITLVLQKEMIRTYFRTV